jgi:hypothetical protein
MSQEREKAKKMLHQQLRATTSDAAVASLYAFIPSQFTAFPKS